MGKIVKADPPPAPTTREEIVKFLETRGARRDLAVMYADALLEYREASANIAENGVIVKHPRTANPIDNPYLKVRDGAMKKLKGMRRLAGQEDLW